MTRSKEIRICDWVDVDPLSVRPLPGMMVDQRFATVAVLGDRVVGLWSYTVRRRRGRVVIESGYTEVLSKHRREGLATKLWLAGIGRWKPEVVYAAVASWRGARFLASMTVRLVGNGPELVVARAEWSGFFERALSELALRALAATRVPAPAKLRSVP